MSDEVLVKAEGVSKKFCRSLKRSLWYGLQDVGSEILGRKGGHDVLRKNEFWAVDDVSFELRRGECLGLIGPNGAGKSTLLKMLNGLVKPDKGRITMRGRVGALIELGAGFNPILTARENIYVNGAVLGLTKKEVNRKFDAIVDFAGLAEFIDTPVQHFSSGMRVRLGFSIASQFNPDVLLIDEVLAVGDASFRAKCMARIYRQIQQCAVIFVSHSMAQIHRLSTKALHLTGRCSPCIEDVENAIHSYLASFQPRNELIIGSEDDSAKGLEICGEKILSSNEVIKVVTGEPFSLAFVCSLIPGTERIAIMVSFFTREQNCAAECYSHPHVTSASNVPGKLKVSMQINHLILTPGRYSLQVSCVDLDEHGRRQDIQFVHPHVAEIQVVGSSYSYASVEFPGEWRFDSLDNPVLDS